MTGYWNHNTAYHPWILRIAAQRPRASALDVGCGDGLLLERLASVADHVTGLEPDPVASARAQEMLLDVPNATVRQVPFLDHRPAEPAHDLIVFVASLHHMELSAALTHARDLLRPGGELLVVGLAANKSIADWVISALQFPVVRSVSKFRREHANPGVVSAEPRESLAEIRSTVADILPGARIRRGLYYRYLQRWTRP